MDLFFVHAGSNPFFGLDGSAFSASGITPGDLPVGFYSVRIQSGGKYQTLKWINRY